MQELINTNFRNNGCLNDCIGYILNRHPVKLPFIYRFNDWLNRTKDLFEMFGYSINGYEIKNIDDIKMSSQKQYIVCGYTKKTKDPNFAHAIVIDSNKNVLYDRRTYNSSFKEALKGGIYYIFEIYK